jgi:hypothetical protein
VRSDLRLRVHARGRRNAGGRVNRHKFV